MKKLVPEASPVEVVSDFETALWSSFRKVYPDVRMKGCSFHHCQAIYRKINDLGLGTRYKNDNGTHSFP